MTSLLGGSCGGSEPTGDRMGAAEPYEKVTDCESGPTLDLGLPSCCDSGRIERRRIQDPFDETESRTSSGVSEAAASPPWCRTKDCRRLLVLGGVNWVLRGRACDDGKDEAVLVVVAATVVMLDGANWLGRVWYLAASSTGDVA